MKKLLKPLLVCTVGGVAGGFAGHLLYELVSKPDGTLYLDPEDKGIYASLKQDPDKYRNGSRLIFKYKKK